jgi:uncharacterized protein (TIGR03067 family)
LRHRFEPQLLDADEPADTRRSPIDALTGRELCAAVDEELARLPERYRLPIVLCCLDGLTRDEAAHRLGWSVQSLKGRLERGRQRLRRRLQNRGLAPATALAAATVAASRARCLDLAPLTAGLLRDKTVSPAVHELCHGVLHAMRHTRVKLLSTAAALLLALTGYVALGVQTRAEPPPAPPKPQPAPNPAVAASPLRGNWATLNLHRQMVLPQATWAVTDDTITWDPDGQPRRFSYKTDLKTVPPVIDLTALDGPDKGKTYPGIFLRDGDYLDVCFDDRPNAKRPRAFVATSDLGGNRSFLFLSEKGPPLIDASPQLRFWMKHLAHVFHAYVQKNGQLPPAFVADKAGTPLYSWRVELCPFMEQKVVYNQWQKDKAWDAGENVQLSQLSIKMYAAYTPAGVSASETPFQVVAGKGTLFDGAKSQKLPDADALSTTILMVETANRVNWTSPRDLFFEPNQPLPDLGGIVEGGFHALMADGSIRFIKRKMNEKLLGQLLRREKEKPVKWEDLDRE